MSIKSINPYVILNGRANQAIELYQQALEAELTTLQRFGDVDQSCPQARRDLIMHAELRTGDVVLMLSDGPQEGPVPREGAVQIALALSNETALRHTFDALSAGGQVLEAVMTAPWGDMFGALVDKFGVGWMMTCPRTR